MGKGNDRHTIYARTDRRGTYHVDNYIGDPRGPHMSDHVSIKSDGSWRWDERDEDDNITHHKYDSI